MLILILQSFLSAVANAKKRIFMAYRASSEVKMLGDVISLHELMLPCGPDVACEGETRLCSEEQTRSPKEHIFNQSSNTRFTSMFDHF